MESGLYADLWTTQMGDKDDDKKKGKEEKPSATIKRLMEENSLLKKQLAAATRALKGEALFATKVAQGRWRKVGTGVMALGRMGAVMSPDERAMVGDDIPADAEPPMVSARSQTLPTYLESPH